jgi:hypothetical protein
LAVPTFLSIEQVLGVGGDRASIDFATTGREPSASFMKALVREAVRG